MDIIMINIPMIITTLIKIIIKEYMILITIITIKITTNNKKK